MTDKQINMAYWMWQPAYRFLEADDRVAPFLKFAVPEGHFGWLKMAREAQFLTLEAVAKKLGLSTKSYFCAESAEREGRLAPVKMHAISKALNCDLIYGLRPKSERLFSEIIWEELAMDSLEHRYVQSRPDVRKANALAYVARLKMRDLGYRRVKGGTEKF